MKNVGVIIALIVVLVGGLLLYKVQTPATSSVSTYENGTYGISFEYSGTYELQEREVGTAERFHYTITLIDKNALANIPKNGEGPPTINVEIFQNNLDDLSVESWVRTTNFSNFKLSPDDALASTTVDGAPALSYTWDGLYRGRSIVFAHKGNIIMLSVQWFTEGDLIIEDFADLLASFTLN